MLERYLLLNAAAAILLACLAAHVPAVSRRLGRAGLALFVAGALLPFLDTALFHVITSDRIDLLSRAPLVAAPIFAVTLVAGLTALAAFVLPPRRVLVAGLVLLGGYGTHIAVSLLTPVGWPLFAPSSGVHVSLPILPGGHPPLLLALFGTLLAAEALPRRRRWIVPAAAVLVVLYGLAGAVQFGVVAYRSRDLAERGATVHVYPDGDWLTDWLVVREDAERYELRRYRWLDAERPEPEVAPRWNDQALFIKLLADPVVNRFYFRVFQHPVVRLDVSGSRITLLMQELRDLNPPVPGPTFYLESDLTGRNRFYQLQRFN